MTPKGQTSQQAWERMFAVAQRYTAANGPDALTTTTVVRGKRVGAWLHNQRTRFRRGILQPDRVERITALGVPLAAEPTAAAAEARRLRAVEVKLSAVERFVDQHGPDALIASSKMDGMPVGRWAADLRRRAADKTLPAAVGRRMRDLGLPMSRRAVQTRVEDRYFERTFPVVAEFVAQHGSDALLASTVHNGVRIGSWVASRRDMYRAGKLPARHAKRLTALGIQLRKFTPRQRRDARWGKSA